MADLVLTEMRENGALVTLNRPETRNALSGKEMVDALLAALDVIRTEGRARVIVLTGAGTAFSSGGDLNQMRATNERAGREPWALIDHFRHGIQRIPTFLAEFPLPIIAAVNGPAIGAGCDLACMCEIRIAARSARFAESFVKLGIISADGGSWLLPRIIGKSKAYELALTGDPLDAEGALACGLVSKVVDDDRLLDEAFAIAARIARNPPFAVQMTKLLMREAESGSIGSALKLSAALQALAHTTPEHRAALEKAPGRKS